MLTVPNTKSVNHLKLLQGMSFQVEAAFLNGSIGLSWPGMSLHTCRGCVNRKHIFVEIVKPLW